jgi:hypothetical protein
MPSREAVVHLPKVLLAGGNGFIVSGFSFFELLCTVVVRAPTSLDVWKNAVTPFALPT